MLILPPSLYLLYPGSSLFLLSLSSLSLPSFSTTCSPSPSLLPFLPPSLPFLPFLPLSSLPPTHPQAVSGPSPPHKDAAVGSVDLLLRWVTLRFFDTNTTVNLKCLDFLHALFQMLIRDEEYRMTDYEANAFIPYLVQKVL